MTHGHGAHCACVPDHRPHPLDGEWHHVWPLGMGGPDVDENQVFVCGTTHNNVHAILRAMVRLGPMPWGAVERLFPEPVSRYAYRLALLGHRRWVAGALVQ